VRRGGRAGRLRDTHLASGDDGCGTDQPEREQHVTHRAARLDGIEATHRITRPTPSSAVVVLTMFEDEDSVFAAMRAGALATC
jgi:DNA-binding NarL/FixJ family response regulator